MIYANYKIRPNIYVNNLKDVTCKKNISFASDRLYSVKVKDNQGRAVVAAKIARLIPGDKSDDDAVEAIKANWKAATRPVAFIDDIANEFSPTNTDSYFLALEIDNDTMPLAQRILCIAEVSNKPVNPENTKNIDLKRNNMEVDFIETDPNIAYTPSGYRKYRGCGEILLAGICRFAKSKGFDQVTLYSTNHEFFTHIGMPEDTVANQLFDDPDDKHHYIYEGNELESFMQTVQDDYEFQFPD